MVSVALRISDEFRSEIDRLPWVNWSEIAREEVLRQLEVQENFKVFNRIVSKSKLAEEDAINLGIEVNKSLRRKYRELK